MRTKNPELEERLVVGAKIRIGKKYSKHTGGHLKAGGVIELIKGYFEHDNGLYCETQIAPSIYDKKEKDYDSIYHLFGNDLEDFMDCKVLLNSEPNPDECDASKADSKENAGNQIG